ncbi:MAG: hypothetical protein H7328_07920 [Bdellovibrio sp.]|nr:hypothetical protein [Bdellovibrio sp.]
MGRAELLQELREKTGMIELTDKEFWNAPYFPSGVAKGIVVELLGNGRTEWLLQLFKMHPQHYIFWCERETLANPTAFQQRGVNLERIKFVSSKGDLQQPLRLALDSQFYPFIVAPNNFEDIKTFQRFNLLAEKSKSTLFLLADKSFSTAWPISLQLEISSSAEGFKIDIQRQKHGAKVCE